MARIFSSSLFVALTGVISLTGCVTNQTKSTGSSVPQFSAARSVDPVMAKACIISAANKYYLPTRVIHAADTQKGVDGSTVIRLKVDIRDALCSITKSGTVRSVVDVSPKSDDQIEAEKLAAAGKKA